MADVKLNFQIVPTQTAKGLKWTTTQQNSTPQAKDISEMDKNKGHNCIIMGRYAQTKEGKLISKYNGIQGGITQTNGDLNVDITISVTEGTFQTITLYFDKIAQQYPTTLMVDGKTIYNDDYELSILFDEPKQEHTIRFTKWIRPNYHWCIVGIEFLLDRIVIGKSKIKHIQSLVQLQPTQNEPFYSIVESTGDFEFRDNEFVDYARDRIIKSGEKVSITVNDKVLDTFAVSEWNEPDIINNIIGGQLTDISNKLNAEYIGYEYNENRGDREPRLIAILEDILNKANIQYQIADDVSKFLTFIYCDFGYLMKSSYREAIEKICYATMIQCVFIDNVLYFYNARPILKGDEQIINITANAQENDFVQTIVPKNNYDNVIYNNKYFGNGQEIYKSRVQISSDNDGIDEYINSDNGYNDIIKQTVGIHERILFSYEIEIKDELLFNGDLSVADFIVSGISYSNGNKTTFNESYHRRYTTRRGIYVFLKNEEDIENFKTRLGNPSAYPQYINVGLYRLGTTRFKVYVVLDYKKSGDYGYTQIQNIEIELSGMPLNKKNTFSVIKKENNINPYIYNNDWQNELLNDGVRFSNSKQEFGLAQNVDLAIYNAYAIYNDYSKHNGIRFANLTVRCGVDFYDTLGNKAIDWNDKTSELPNALKVGQIVKILDKNGNSKSKRGNGEDIVWRVIGCEFTHEYIPSWHLELMEVW